MSAPFETNDSSGVMELQGADNVPDTKMKCEEKPFVPSNPKLSSESSDIMTVRRAPVRFLSECSRLQSLCSDPVVLN